LVLYVIKMIVVLENEEEKALAETNCKIPA
jgi:hypothetical protein